MYNGRYHDFFVFMYGKGAVGSGKSGWHERGEGASGAVCAGVALYVLAIRFCTVSALLMEGYVYECMIQVLPCSLVEDDLPCLARARVYYAGFK